MQSSQTSLLGSVSQRCLSVRLKTVSFLLMPFPVARAFRAMLTRLMNLSQAIQGTLVQRCHLLVLPHPALGTLAVGAGLLVCWQAGLFTANLHIWGCSTLCPPMAMPGWTWAALTEDPVPVYGSSAYAGGFGPGWG